MVVIARWVSGFSMRSGLTRQDSKRDLLTTTLYVDDVR